MSLSDVLVKYRKSSSIRRIKFQKLNDSRLVLQFFAHPLKSGVKSRMKM